MGTIDIGTDLDSKGDRHPTKVDDRWRIAAWFVVAGLPEAWLLGNVEFGVAGDEVSGRVEDQRGVEALSSDQLGVSIEHARRQVRAGKWPSYKLGKKATRIDVDEIKNLTRLAALAEKK